MMETTSNIGLSMPNLLLIAGNGRNVGKTFFACSIIKQLSLISEVLGIKISSHFHPVNTEDILIKNERFIIVEEKYNSTKDSSLFLQAGAKRVFFLMVHQQYLEEAFHHLQKYLPQHAIVCESGGLHEIINPGLFFFVNLEEKEIIKKQHLKFSPVIVTNNGKEFDFDINKIHFFNNKFELKQ